MPPETFAGFPAKNRALVQDFRLLQASAGQHLKGAPQASAERQKDRHSDHDFQQRIPAEIAGHDRAIVE
jgi:hypothetical protein